MPPHVLPPLLVHQFHIFIYLPLSDTLFNFTLIFLVHIRWISEEWGANLLKEYKQVDATEIEEGRNKYVSFCMIVGISLIVSSKRFIPVLREALWLLFLTLTSSSVNFGPQFVRSNVVILVRFFHPALRILFRSVSPLTSFIFPSLFPMNTFHYFFHDNTSYSQVEGVLLIFLIPS